MRGVTKQEAVRLPRGKKKQIEERQQMVEAIHEADDNEKQYIVAPYKDPDVKGHNNQSVEALGSHRLGNGYNEVVSKDYYGDGTHALLARPKSVGDAENKARATAFKRPPPGTLKTVINTPNFAFMESAGEVLRRGPVDTSRETMEQQMRLREAEENPQLAEVLQRMTDGMSVDDDMGDLESEEI